MLEKINERGGKFIRFTYAYKEYKGVKTQIEVRCTDGHIWSVTVASLLYANSWCSDCRAPLGEQITRRIFEATYEVTFEKIRPDFLITDKGGRLELDGYNEHLRIAFEYNGPHHRKAAQKKRDSEKRKICSEKGITLISIPFVKNPWPPDKVYKAVAREIHKINHEIKIILPKDDFYSKKIEEYRKIAESHGGKLHSMTYEGGRNKMLWSCSNPEHPPFEAIPENVKRGHWCLRCAPNAPLDLEALKEFGKSVGLILVSEEYRGADSVYDWECKNGHPVRRSKGNIIQSVGRGLNSCRICAGTSNNVTIENLIQTALQRQGKCLSKKYKDAHTIYRWCCAYGHKFKRNWNKVQQGYWCTRKGCPDKRRFRKVDLI